MSNATIIDAGNKTRHWHSDVHDDLAPYFAELLADVSEAMIAVVSRDLEFFDRTGHASLTVLSLIKRAQCLLDADRIEMKFAA